MSFKAILKNSIYNGLVGGSGITFHELCIILFAACVLGCYVFLVYKNFSKDAFYSKDLNITLAGMCVIVAGIMIAMQSNLLVSLGMVGALSIVRFRTAVKNPLDLLYLFWSISIGIICGVKLYTLALVLCIIMTILVWLLGEFPIAKAPVLLVVQSALSADVALIEKTLKENCKSYKTSSTEVRATGRELYYEVLVKDKTKLVTEIAQIEGVTRVNCLEHDGEMR